MAVVEGGTSAALAGVGVESSSPLHIVNKPMPYGSLGHYRTAVRFLTTAAQAANANLWEVRNTHATNLIVATRLTVRWIQTGAITTAARYDLEARRVTGFSAVDTTNTVTPTVSPRRTSMAAAPGAAAIRHLTVAGSAAGMTGGTMTADGGAFWIGEMFFGATAAPTTLQTPNTWDLFDDVNGTHPFVLSQNEGIVIRPPTAGSATAFATSISVDFSWAEVSAF